jgi:hypothetical protein
MNLWDGIFDAKGRKSSVEISGIYDVSNVLKWSGNVLGIKPRRTI